MFKKNHRHLQIPLTSNVDELPEKLRKRLENSWAGVFYREIFSRIEEEAFAELYADCGSRPNVAVNLFVALEFLKAGNGWTDEELYDNFSYDIQVRYALGYRQLGEGDFDVRTLYYFRERLSRYMQEKGVNLLDQAFEKVTDAQLKAFQVKTGKQRMDSVQVSSNIRQMGRVQLLVEVLQRVERILSELDQAHYSEAFAPYLKGHSGHYVYRMKGEEVSSHLERIGEFMQRLLVELKPVYGREAVYEVLERVFSEHFKIEQTKVRAKPNTELTSACMQSPDDLEATYREKRGVGYRGYVANLTETCDPENKLQLITKVQLAPNNTDDDQFLAEALPNLKKRTEVDEMNTDGGYGGSKSDPVLAKLNVELIQSAIRGRNPDPEKPHLADFDIQLGEDRKPRQVTCPAGQKVSVRPSSQQKSYVACFELPPCQECPLFKAGTCLAQPGKQSDKRLRLRFTLADAQASQRRRRSQESKRKSGNLRAAVEATVRSVKLPFPDAQLPVRGQFRVTCMLIGSAAVANVRRIQRYLQARLQEEMKQNKVQDSQECAPDMLAPSFLESARTFFTRFLRFRLVLSPVLAG
jgi:Transposase DDE domain/Transposase domain (DUF772)